MKIKRYFVKVGILVDAEDEADAEAIIDRTLKWYDGMPAVGADTTLDVQNISVEEVGDESSD